VSDDDSDFSLDALGTLTGAKARVVSTGACWLRVASFVRGRPFDAIEASVARRGSGEPR